MRKVANKAILQIKPYVPGKPIEEVKRELKLKQVIKLASNENPYGPSPKVVRAISLAAKNVNRYPAGDCYYLREKLAQSLGIKRQQLIFGNGSDEIIVMAVRAFVKKGDEVIIAKPSFLIYEIASQVAEAKVKAVALKDFRYDLEGIKKSISLKTKIIFIGNPDNPAGTYISDQQLKKFLRDIRSDILVFVDEAYFEYVQASDYGRSLNLSKQHKNLLVARTFSKMYALAGLRVGYGIASEGVIDILERVREPFNINSLAQVAAVACLNDKQYYRKVARMVTKERKYLYGQLRRLNLDFKKSFTNFILIKVKQGATVMMKKLLKKGVIVRDMSFWGLKEYIRVTIGTHEENRIFVKTLEAIL